MSRLTNASFARIASIILMLTSSNAHAGEPKPCVSQPQSSADAAIGSWVQATLFDAARRKRPWGPAEAAAATMQQRKSDLATMRETAHETLARFGALSKQQQSEVLAAAAPALEKLKPQSERDQEYLHAIQFNGSALGWAMDWNGRFHRTSDGGVTWTDTRLVDAWVPGLTPEDGMFRSMHFADDRFGLIVGPAGILESRDGGENWETSPLAYFHVPDAVFCDAARTCWVAGDEPNAIYRREISQWAWSPQSTPAASPINAIQFVGSNGWAVSLGGEIAGTTDAGENWTLLFHDASKRFRAIHFVDQRTGWVVGNDALVMRTDDGGKTWHQQTIQLPPHFPVDEVRLNAVRFADSSHGWAAGLHGMIFATTDGGECWHLQRFEGIPQNWLTIYSLAITAGPTIWASGNSGNILVSTDNGKFWFPVHGLAVPVFEELRRAMDRMAK
ncbi:photosystem II stability/assembly factor-like uncharacterized protein [Mesorhizobium sp. USDA 4775]